MEVMGLSEVTYYRGSNLQIIKVLLPRIDCINLLWAINHYCGSKSFKYESKDKKIRDVRGY